MESVVYTEEAGVWGDEDCLVTQLLSLHGFPKKLLHSAT